MPLQLAAMQFVGNILANTISRITAVVTGKAIDRNLVKKNVSNVSKNNQDQQQLLKAIRSQQALLARLGDLKADELAIMETRLNMDKAIAIDKSADRKKRLELIERGQDIQLAIASAQLKESAKFRELVQKQKAEELQIQLQAIQSNWDEKNLPTILSRQEIQNILVEGQRRPQLLMLCSSPDIAAEDQNLSSFRMYLPQELRGGLIRFLETNYSLENNLCPVEFYGKFFTKSVFDLEVKQQLRNILAPVPTAVLYSDLTDHEFLLYIAFWGYSNNQFSPIAVEPVNWLKIKKELTGNWMSDEDSLRVIRQLIVEIHKLFAAFLVDVYYLGIDIFYQPQLFHLANSFSQEWFPQELLQHCISSLQTLKSKQLQAYEEQLIEAEKQTSVYKDSQRKELMLEIAEMKSRIEQRKQGEI